MPSDDDRLCLSACSPLAFAPTSHRTPALLPQVPRAMFSSSGPLGLRPLRLAPTRAMFSSSGPLGLRPQQNDPTNKLSDSDPGGGSRILESAGASKGYRRGSGILESAGASKGYGRGSHPHRIRARGKPLTQKSPQPTARGGWEAGRRIISARQGSRIRQQTSQGVQEESAALQTLTAVKRMRGKHCPEAKSKTLAPSEFSKH